MHSVLADSGGQEAVARLRRPVLSLQARAHIRERFACVRVRFRVRAVRVRHPSHGVIAIRVMARLSPRSLLDTDSLPAERRGPPRSDTDEPRRGKRLERPGRARAEFNYFRDLEVLLPKNVLHSTEQAKAMKKP